MQKALLVGINKYPGNELRGCVNDIHDMAKFLVSDFGFKVNEIQLLTDESATTVGIKEKLNWLITDVKAGDKILFHYSGHGAQVPTFNPKSEPDGKDEVICPVDFNWSPNFMITDKQFNKLFSTVPKDVEFIWLSDSCHSGDLSREFTPKPKWFSGISHNEVKNMNPPVDILWALQMFKTVKDAIFGGFSQKSLGLEKTSALHNDIKPLNCALISGCKSTQTSSDASFKNKPNGAFTYYFLKTLKEHKNEPLKTLVTMINLELKRNGFTQNPQLEGSEEIMNKAFMK